MLDRSSPIRQGEFGELVGVSQQAISDLVTRGVLVDGDALGVWLLAYCRNLREQASGRDTLLSGERASLARAQRERIEMQNAVTRGELAPVVLIEEVLTKAASKVAGVLEAIPGMVRRRVPALTADEIHLIAGEVAKARNMVAAMSLSDLVDVADDADVCSDGPG
jgi:phage terminase Nu1 subunit (DNA packaging protein)